MHAIVLLYQQHPYISTLATYYFVSAFIGALPAPTSTSSTFYVFFFRFSNALGANVVRALNTVLEKSPNWQDAVQKAQDQKQLGGVGVSKPS